MMIVSKADEHHLTVSVIPKRLKDSENAALATPFCCTGTPEELDRELPTQVREFVAGHVALGANLAEIQREREEAEKAAREELVEAAGQQTVEALRRQLAAQAVDQLERGAAAAQAVALAQAVQQRVDLADAEPDGAGKLAVIKQESDHLGRAHAACGAVERAAGSGFGSRRTGGL